MTIDVKITSKRLVRRKLNLSVQNHSLNNHAVACSDQYKQKYTTEFHNMILTFGDQILSTLLSNTLGVNNIDIYFANKHPVAVTFYIWRFRSAVRQKDEMNTPCPSKHVVDDSDYHPYYKACATVITSNDITPIFNRRRPLQEWTEPVYIAYTARTMYFSLWAFTNEALVSYNVFIFLSRLRKRPCHIKCHLRIST